MTNSHTNEWMKGRAKILRTKGQSHQDMPLNITKTDRKVKHNVSAAAEAAKEC